MSEPDVPGKARFNPYVMLLLLAGVVAVAYVALGVSLFRQGPGKEDLLAELESGMTVLAAADDVQQEMEVLPDRLAEARQELQAAQAAFPSELNSNNTMQTILELAKHPNIAGMKDSAPEGPVKLLARLDPAEDFHVLAGSADFMYPCLHLGAAGGIMSVANFVPGPCCDLYRLFLQGRYDQAKELHFRISRLNQTVSGLSGVAGVKAAMDIAGFRGGAPRYPLAAVTGDDARRIKQQLLNEGFLSG